MTPELLGAAMAVLVAALPVPPDTVVRTTRSFGTVTLDHKAHLQRRISCRACHGQGPVRKIEFTPRSGHAACRNCHAEQRRGPTGCRDCHVVAVPDPGKAAAAEVLVAAATALPTGSPAAPAGAGALTPDVRIPGSTIGQALDVGAATPFTKTAEFGVVAIGGQRQGLVAGPSLQLTARSGWSAISFGLALSGGRGSGRTQILVGGGGGFNPQRRIRLTAVALGGLDATHSTVSLMPALGVRAGAELVGDSPWSVGLSATGLADLRQTDARGERTGGVTYSVGMTAGYRLSR